ncbi:OmpA family protein [Belliella marina]|uniref:OmpA family protein n=1 Tax=Belliella marina TaxID=1644146 RepID=A0ABW4VL29_9BACT
MLKNYTIIAYLILFFTVGCVSLKDRYLNSAQENEGMLNYSLAKDDYLKSWNESENELAARGLAQSNLKIRDFEQAEAWYTKLLKMEAVENLDYFNFAKVLAANAKFGEAKTNLGIYLDNGGGEVSQEEVESLKVSIEKGKNLVNESTESLVEPIKGVNTPFSEFAPQVVGTGLSFVSDRVDDFEGKIDYRNSFSGKRYGWTGNGFLSVYRSTYDSTSNTATGIEIHEDYRYDFHIGPIYETPSIVFYSKSPVPKESRKFTIKKVDLTVFPGIYYREVNEDSTYSKEKSLPVNSSLEYLLIDPFWDEDAQTLYFASDMPGGYGGTDIYKIQKLGDGTWSEVENLGPDVNTFGDERSPSIDQLQDLYFSSNGHPGLGGLDIFRIKNYGNNAGEAENLGSPINSNRDDFSFIKLDGNKAYISSDRVGGKGSDDLYQVILNYEEFFVLNGVVLDKADRSPIPDAVVTAINLDNGVNLRYITDGEGRFTFRIPFLQAYDLAASSTGYIGSELKKVVDGSQRERAEKEKSVEVLLDRLVINKVYSVENIFYDFDKWDIRPDAEGPLMNLVKIMSENPTLKIELHSHTDARGARRYNQTLSEKRAQSAVDFIVGKGIGANRIKAIGFGMEQLLNGCAPGVECTEEEHQLNRRTEFKIIDL